MIIKSKYQKIICRLWFLKWLKCKHGVTLLILTFVKAKYTVIRCGFLLSIKSFVKLFFRRCCKAREIINKNATAFKDISNNFGQENYHLIINSLILDFYAQILQDFREFFLSFVVVATKDELCVQNTLYLCRLG